MSLSILLILVAAALLLRLLMTLGHRREWMLAASVLAVFWLQPELGIRNLDFWFPMATLFLVLLSWLFVTPQETRKERQNLWTILAIVGLCLAMAGSKELGWQGILTASIPPNLLTVFIGLLALAAIYFIFEFILRKKKMPISILAIFLIASFILLKEPYLAAQVSGWLRSLNHQNPALAAANELSWLGYSYIAFRLLHTLRDKQTGHLPALPLRDYMLYVIFFPSLQAGPIDRIQRFQSDLSDRLALKSEDFEAAGQRLALGLMKKFVLANSLAVIALSETSVHQIHGAGWMGLSLYAYSFMIYFDFSGYTDIAIGLARLLGVHMPENFNHPYRQANLTLFWNNWHITLTQWFRAYFFNPLTRGIRRKAKFLPAWLALLIPQLLTMTLIGLWHGITWNFALWGIWHGLGLFVQNRWSAWIQPRIKKTIPGVKWINVFLTFNFVSLGWIFFLTQNLSSVWQVFRVLAGR
jgi:alginate O-acetyltransferase complex protein AlgI